MSEPGFPAPRFFEELKREMLVGMGVLMAICSKRYLDKTREVKKNLEGATLGTSQSS